MHKATTVAVLSLAALSAIQGLRYSSDEGNSPVYSPAFNRQLQKNHESLALTQEAIQAPTQDAIIIWNPISASVSSGCAASGCLASGCVSSGCLGSVCWGSGCAGSGCLGSACAGSVCAGSGCFGSVCVGSGCFGSVCVGSGCFGNCKRVATIELSEGPEMALVAPWWQRVDGTSTPMGD